MHQPVELRARLRLPRAAFGRARPFLTRAVEVPERLECNRRACRHFGEWKKRAIGAERALDHAALHEDLAGYDARLFEVARSAKCQREPEARTYPIIPRLS